MDLVTGAAGMLGSYFKGSQWHKTDIDSLDVTNAEQVKKTIGALSPTTVYHLAAATDVDQCEKDPDMAFRVNAIGTQNVALACQQFGIPMVYISTAGVFAGDKPEPYTEFDEPRPANIYGHAKLAGERIVQSLLNRYYIVRAGWMIGGGKDKDKKFVGKMLQLFSERTTVSAVNDKFGSPTYAKDLAAFLPRLVETGAYGLYHFTNRGVCSRYDVACELAKLKKASVEILPVSSAVFPLPAPRARSEAMRNYKADLMGLAKARSWQDALKDYLSEW